MCGSDPLRTIGSRVKTRPMSLFLKLASISSLAMIAGACVAEQSRQYRETARERQWLYREVLGSGEVDPTAVFLSSDYSGVVFSAKCDRRTRELVLRSDIGTGPDAPATEPLEISSSSSTIRLRTTANDGQVEGRTRVTGELASILRSEGDLQVFIPTEMGEPLYVGRAEPLRGLALSCGR